MRNTDLLASYDLLRDRLREAEARSAVALTAYENACMDVEMLEAEVKEAREAIEAAMAGSRAEAAPSTPARGATGNDVPGRPGPKASGPPLGMPSMATLRPPSPSPVPAAAPEPIGVRPSFWDLLLLIPLDGDVGMPDLRERFPNLTEGAINTRVTKAKKAGLVESAGWGRYRLTTAGRSARSQRLHVIGED